VLNPALHLLTTRPYQVKKFIQNYT